jgi:hypothetical protein
VNSAGEAALAALNAVERLPTEWVTQLLNAMDIIFPRIKLASLPPMIRLSLLGALLAGIYGAAHDQVSYSISEEYFTKLKFHQFWYANFGFPPRVFAAEVGFLASWWVGMIVAWFLARLGLTELPSPQWQATTVVAFSIVLVFALVTGACGLLLGFARSHGEDLSSWALFERTLQLTNLPRFVIVAYLHNGSYLGGLVGFIIAAVFVHVRVKKYRRAERQAAVAIENH